MNKIQIHGKDYVMVKDRIIFFNENCPNGSIVTESKATNNSFIFKAIVTPDVENPNRKFTGHAEEVIGSSQINTTSALENCETSAIGRALGCMGIGVEGAFASADEVNNAVYQQNYKYKKTDNELEKYIKYKDDEHFLAYLKDNGKTITEINDKWDECNSKTKTHLFLNQMKEKIDGEKQLITEGE